MVKSREVGRCRFRSHVRYISAADVSGAITHPRSPSCLLRSTSNWYAPPSWAPSPCPCPKSSGKTESCDSGHKILPSKQVLTPGHPRLLDVVGIRILLLKGDFGMGSLWRYRHQLLERILFKGVIGYRRRCWNGLLRGCRFGWRPFAVLTVYVHRASHWLIVSHLRLIICDRMLFHRYVPNLLLWPLFSTCRSSSRAVSLMKAISYARMSLYLRFDISTDDLWTGHSSAAAQHRFPFRFVFHVYSVHSDDITLIFFLASRLLLCHTFAALRWSGIDFCICKCLRVLYHCDRKFMNSENLQAEMADKFSFEF
jgi:hypothetical protein